MKSSSHRRFCAFCRSPRVVYAKKHITSIDAALAAAAALAVSFILWQDFDPRAIVIFVLGLGVGELFISFRWRMSIACTRCGFDPVLYMKSPESAALRVKTYMAERRADPLSAFVPPPNLPTARIVKKPIDRRGSPKDPQIGT